MPERDLKLANRTNCLDQVESLAPVITG